jgi:hypothetical protein
MSMETIQKRYGGPVMPPRWTHDIEVGTTLRHRDKLRELRRARGWKNADKTNQRETRSCAVTAFLNDTPEYLPEPGHA